jgi:hypothetical protein
MGVIEGRNAVVSIDDLALPTSLRVSTDTFGLRFFSVSGSWVGSSSSERARAALKARRKRRARLAPRNAGEVR